MAICITASGLYTPEARITNEELVESLNKHAEWFNHEYSAQIESGLATSKKGSSAAFIEKVSGIKARHVIDKDGVLNPERMRPSFSYRSDEQISLQAEIGVKAAQKALDSAGLQADQLDAVILACSNMQRAYPAVAIEIQAALGMTQGYAFDMNVACSAATFGIEQAVNSIKAGQAKRVLVVNAEITSGHLNWTERDSHFIFGDVATAVIVEQCDEPRGYEVLGTKLLTQFSNNIRNNFGFLNRTEVGAPESDPAHDDKLFVQNGRAVFKEVCPKVVSMITQHLADHQMNPDQVARFWLHQANANMNEYILKTMLGREFDPAIAPVILDEYANTSSAGSIIAFNLYGDDLQSGDVGVICSFGAGYSIGSVLIKKV